MRTDGGYTWITLAYDYNMIMSDDGWWMYDGQNKSGAYSHEWMVKTQKFVDHAFTTTTTSNDVLCPCTNYHNYKYMEKRMMTLHLCTYGFYKV